MANDNLVKKKIDVSAEIQNVGQQFAPTMAQMGLDPAMLAGLQTSYSLGMLDKGIVGHLTLVQPIFAGGQIYNGNQLAKIGTRAAKLQETLVETEIRKNTETYYWLIVLLKEKLKTIDEAQKQVEAIRKDVEASLENINPPNDYKMSANEAVERRAESKLLAIGREVAEKERSMERG